MRSHRVVLAVGLTMCMAVAACGSSAKNAGGLQAAPPDSVGVGTVGPIGAESAPPSTSRLRHGVGRRNDRWCEWGIGYGFQSAAGECGRGARWRLDDHSVSARVHDQRCGVGEQRPGDVDVRVEDRRRRADASAHGAVLRPRLTVAQREPRLLDLRLHAYDHDRVRRHRTQCQAGADGIDVLRTGVWRDGSAGVGQPDDRHLSVQCHVFDQHLCGRIADRVPTSGSSATGPRRKRRACSSRIPRIRSMAPCRHRSSPSIR